MKYVTSMVSQIVNDMLMQLLSRIYIVNIILGQAIILMVMQGHWNHAGRLQETESLFIFRFK